MSDSSQEERARRILGWLAEKHEWTGNYDYFKVTHPFSGPIQQMMMVNPMGLPELMTRDELVEQIFRCPKLVQRMQKAGWLTPLPNLRSKKSLFSRAAAYVALERLLLDERPPTLRSERPLKKKVKP